MTPVLPPPGVLCIDKPAGMTSHDVVASVRRLIGQKRVGHAGTLDPLATGVLLVCIGTATRISDYLQAGRKVYRTLMRLGAATTTYDAEGDTTHTAIVPDFRSDDILAALQPFTGEIEQVPPMYSAIKQGGVPLYKLARAGIEVERAARQVVIDDITLEAWQSPDITLRIRCSSGTYVRSLVHDIGLALGVYAHVRELRRLASGNWHVDNAVALATLQQNTEDWQHYLVPLSRISLGLPTITLTEVQVRAFAYGQAISLANELEANEYQVLGPDGRCLGIGRVSPQSALLAPSKVFIDPTMLSTF
ncbi:MAG: tRNA pseudouridine(55) synthase TruB [Chloroflexi bacterium]|nr:tRNA pseudouridine(55) synthase TruB [Chloroflexota bacterium]